MNKKPNDPFVIQRQAANLRDPVINDFRRNNDAGSFLFAENASSLWLGEIISFFKFNLAFAFIIFLFLALFFRLGYLQLLRGEEYQQLSEGNRIRLEYQLPARGIIFDRFQQPLVENIPTFTLYYSPSELIKTAASERQKVEDFLKNLEIGGKKIETEKISELLSSKSQLPLVVKENLSYEEAVNLMINVSGYASLKVAADPRRNYLSENNALAHLLGYTNRITSEDKDEYVKKGYQLIERVGRSGIEEYYEDQLRGTLGSKRIEVDSLGREKKILTEDKAQAGHNLILAIDGGLQEKIAEVLKDKLKNKAAAVVALDPRSGKIRALLSWPSFDNNAFGQNLSSEAYQSVINDPLKPLINRVIAAEYPSGSTIKMLIAAAGLQEKLVSRSSTVSSTGGVWYDKWFFPDWKAGGHGLTNVIKALAESVNTYFYYLALENFDGHNGLGLERMLSYFKKFGLGDILGIDLTGEKGGFVPSQEWKEETKGEIWYPGDTLHLAIGQGDILVTPLQIAALTSTVANGGILYRPELIEQIEDPQTGQKQIIGSKVITSGIISAENLSIVAEGMRSSVTSGSSRGVALANLDIAGKTGTAQVGGDQIPHAWFTSFAPYENPEMVLTIIVENGGEGSSTAVPLAREIWQWYIENRK